MRFQFPITVLASASAVAIALGNNVADFLAYDRGEIRRGQLWRLLTCHFTHWSPSHAFWSIGALVILAAICELRNRPLTAITILVSSIVISTAIFLLAPTLQFYRGLSGIDSALFGLLAMMLLAQRPIQPTRTLLVSLALAGFVAKVFYESRRGLALFADGSVVPLPLAHLVGLASGLCMGMFPIWLSRHNVCTPSRHASPGEAGSR